MFPQFVLLIDILEIELEECAECCELLEEVNFSGAVSKCYQLQRFFGLGQDLVFVGFDLNPGIPIVAIRRYQSLANLECFLFNAPFGRDDLITGLTNRALVAIVFHNRPTDLEIGDHIVTGRVESNSRLPGHIGDLLRALKVEIST